jgi:hypothetical protein
MITAQTPKGSPKECLPNANEPSAQFHWLNEFISKMKFSKALPFQRFFPSQYHVLFHPFFHSFHTYRNINVCKICLHTKGINYFGTDIQIFECRDQLFWYWYTKLTDSFDDSIVTTSVFLGFHVLAI